MILKLVSVLAFFCVDVNGEAQETAKSVKIFVPWVVKLHRLVGRCDILASKAD